MRIDYLTYLRKTFAVAIFACFAHISFAQAIHTSVNKKDILIGEQITYELSIDLPSPEYKISVTIPDSIPHFDVIQKSGGDPNSSGKYTWQQKIVFTSFDSGSWTFPAFAYRINHLNTASQILFTDSFKINVGYMPIDEGAQPRDIKSILEVSFFDWFWVYIGGGILLLLIIAFLLYRYFKKRKKNLPERISATAYNEAMQALADLKTANEQQSLSVKEYHTKLADVLKNYYSKKVNQNFLNKTTTEILAKLKSHELRAETESHTAEALQTGDAVKFAKYHSSYTENEAALNYLKNTIDEIESSLSKKD